MPKWTITIDESEKEIIEKISDFVAEIVGEMAKKSGEEPVITVEKLDQE